MDVVLLMVFVSVLLSLFFIVLFFCFSKKNSSTGDSQRDALLPLEGDEHYEALTRRSKKSSNNPD
jgi:cbb3-type cytochrome oxidase subunit 3